MFFNIKAFAGDSYTLTKDYTVTINGTSNLHNWDETVETVAGQGTVSWNSDGSFDLQALNLKMEVNSIKSDMGSVMNNNTYRALKADAHPEITLVLNSPVKSIKPQSGEATIYANANLSIAGVTHTITIRVKILVLKPGMLTFEGSQVINMTDYGVQSPTALFGTLKTGPDITINFKTNFTSASNLTSIN